MGATGQQDGVPAGHRGHANWLLGLATQRAIARGYRPHHTEDHHTVDGLYPALDEAFIRIEARERPSAARRLARLRAWAAGLPARREYAREANWIAANDAADTYAHRLRRHQARPDVRPAPSKAGYELLPADAARIGPTAADVDVECDDRIDDMRPRLPELLLQHAAGEASTATLRNRLAAVQRERRRALLLKGLAAVRDDYFEPRHWAAQVDDSLRDYVRLAEMGDPASEADAWHAAAKRDIASSARDGDLAAVCRAFAHARGGAGETVWEPPAAMPAITVSGGTGSVSLAWSGSLPANVSVRTVTVLVGEGLQIGAAAASNSFTAPGFLPVAGSGRAAVLVQPMLAEAGKDTLYGVGAATVVDVAAVTGRQEAGDGQQGS